MKKASAAVPLLSRFPPLQERGRFKNAGTILSDLSKLYEARARFPDFNRTRESQGRRVRYVSRTASRSKLPNRSHEGEKLRKRLSA